MNEMIVKYYITDEQMRKMQALKALCDGLGVMKSDSIGDLFTFMMMWGSTQDIDRRIAAMSDMAHNTERQRKD